MVFVKGIRKLNFRTVLEYRKKNYHVTIFFSVKTEQFLIFLLFFNVVIYTTYLCTPRNCAFLC